jgi:hypothetical protein
MSVNIDRLVNVYCANGRVVNTLQPSCYSDRSARVPNIGVIARDPRDYWRRQVIDGIRSDAQQARAVRAESNRGACLFEQGKRACLV